MKSRKLLPTKYFDEKKGKEFCKVREITLINTKKTKFQLFKEFINSIEIGQTFTRRDLFHAVYSSDVAPTLLQRENIIDHYRLYSTHIGFLERIDRAKYIKKCNIPDTINTTKLEQYAYNNTWLKWFVPVEKIDK